MRKLSDPDPNIGCCILVGQFLQNWALMESRVDDAIGKAFGLDILQKSVVCSHLGFREKIFILKTAIHLSLVLTEDKERFGTILDRLQNYSAKRNMIAHRLFFPTDDGERVAFVVTKARGPLSFPSVEWGNQQFQRPLGSSLHLLPTSKNWSPR
jgi:hypothetical protein